MIPFRCLPLLLLFVMPTPGHAQSTALPDSARIPTAGHPDTSGAILAPGDLLRVSVWRRPDLTGDFVVAPDSSITHPLYREVKVAGVPLRVVEDRVRLFLGKYETNAPFVISPLLRVFVGGEVRAPSVYTVAPGTTIAQVVAIAGGPTDRGNVEAVSLVRHEQRQSLDLTRPDTHSATIEVRSGDQLLIARRRNFFFDVLAPSSSVFAAAASVASIIIQLSR